MWFGKKKCSVEDVVWVSGGARLAGIVREVTSTTAAGISCLVAAHFRDTFESVRASLEAGGVRPEAIESRVDSAWLVSRIESAPHPGAYLIISDQMKVLERPATAAKRSPNLRVIAVERYPTGSRDEAILRFAEACGLEGFVRFHSSLDDPLFRRFAGDKITSLWRALGGTEDEPIESNHVSSAIRAAQKRVERESIADERVSSSDEWFTYNVRRQK